MGNFAEFKLGLEYDAWANRLWLNCLNRKETGDPDRSVMSHILSAQKVWLLRCQGESLGYMPKVEAEESILEELTSGWQEVLDKVEGNPVISYHRTTGEAMSVPFKEIVLQVLNHGSYHRGELRGLCLSRGDEDYPETDRLLFWMQTTPSYLE